MSNLHPQTYDENAINYDVKNANIINSVSAAIGVSPAAVAASISREITRADDEMAAGATGEHAVSVDMAKNEFHPFTPGSKGGQVGPWVLFGNNYSNLNAILAKGGSLGLSVAPVSRPKPVQKASSKYMKYAEAGAALAPVRNVLDALPANHNSADRITGNATNAPATKYITRAGGLPQALTRGTKPAFLSAVNQRGRQYAALAQGRPGRLIPELKLGQKNLKLASSRFLTNRHKGLPSVAPVARPLAVMSTQQLMAHHSDTGSPGDGQHSAAWNQGTQKIREQNLQVALGQLLDRQARLPPSGPTAFDPLLTPAWAGLKIPM